MIRDHCDSGVTPGHPSFCGARVTALTYERYETDARLSSVTTGDKPFHVVISIQTNINLLFRLKTSQRI